jgi:hypothetical protein
VCACVVCCDRVLSYTANTTAYAEMPSTAFLTASARSTNASSNYGEITLRRGNVASATYKGAYARRSTANALIRRHNRDSYTDATDTPAAGGGARGTAGVTRTAATAAASDAATREQGSASHASATACDAHYHARCAAAADRQQCLHANIA